MPPKVKVTKEEIIAAALEILRQKGMEAVNARAVAAALGCSTQPIFSNYSSMGALQHDVLAAGYAEYNRWIEQQMKEGQYPPYKASGMAYISFARRQPQLFKVLFMRDRTGEPQPAEDEPVCWSPAISIWRKRSSAPWSPMFTRVCWPAKRRKPHERYRIAGAGPAQKLPRLYSE